MVFQEVPEGQQRFPISIAPTHPGRVAPGLVYEMERLRTGVQRWSMMRPTKSEFAEADWKTDEGWLHWDQNPWSQPKFLKIQAMLTLSEHTPTSGGFECVPGAVKHFERWGQENPPKSETETGYGLVKLPDSDPWQAQATKVCAPAGSLILWDGRTPHCNYPNEDKSALRICQYMSLTPVEDGDANRDDISAVLFAASPSDPFPRCLSLLGQKLLGFAPWDATDLVEVHLPSENAREASKAISEAQALEGEGHFSQAIAKYKLAKKLDPHVAELHGII